jgi:hypothetical protein
LGIVAGTRTKSGSTNFLRLHYVGDRDPVLSKKAAVKSVPRKPAPVRLEVTAGDQRPLAESPAVSVKVARVHTVAVPRHKLRQRRGR